MPAILQPIKVTSEIDFLSFLRVSLKIAHLGAKPVLARREACHSNYNNFETWASNIYILSIIFIWINYTFVRSCSSWREGLQSFNVFALIIKFLRKTVVWQQLKGFWISWRSPSVFCLITPNREPTVPNHLLFSLHHRNRSIDHLKMNVPMFNHHNKSTDHLHR